MSHPGSESWSGRDPLLHSTIHTIASGGYCMMAGGGYYVMGSGGYYGKWLVVVTTWWLVVVTA